MDAAMAPLERQMTDAGLSDDAIKVNSTLMRAMLARFADAEGITPEDALQRYGLAIQSGADDLLRRDTVLNQFAGPFARSANLDNLAQAKRMMESNHNADAVHANAVRRSTGWFQGTDGKWRYEIPDDEAKFRQHAEVTPEDIERGLGEGDITFSPDKDVPTLRKALYKGGTPDYIGAFGYSEDDARRNLINHLARRSNLRAFDIDKIEPGDEKFLEVVLDHPKLFQAYPQFGLLKVRFLKSADFHGAYHEKDGRIDIHISGDHAQMLSTLLHEIQHAIQSVEGYALGGMPDADFAVSVRNALGSLDASSKEAIARWKYGNAEKLDAAQSAIKASRYALMYESAQRLREYARRDKPSGVFRLIRNEMQWIYQPEMDKNDDVQQLQRDFYTIPKPGRMQARNAHLRDMALRGAQALLRQIPDELRESFENDKRSMKAMVSAFDREASRRRRALAPLRDLERQSRDAQGVADAHKHSSPFDIYHALSGEVEARNTQARQKMSADERMRTPPDATQDTPSDHHIIMFGGMDVQVPSLRRSANRLSPPDNLQRVADGMADDRRQGPTAQSEGSAYVFDWSEPGGGARETQVGDSRIIYGYDGKSAHIISLRTPSAKRGQGSARRAMERFLHEADRLGIPVKLESSPLDKRTKDARLFRFYTSLGFEPTGRRINPAGDPEMLRLPQPMATQSLQQRGDGTMGNALGMGDKAVDQTETPEFKQWFGDSKVVDENGKPLVVYHGTAYTDIEKFLPNGGRDGEWQRALEHFRSAQSKGLRYGYMNFRSGSFFSPQPDYAGSYTRENWGVMYPVFVRAENPVYFDQATKEVTGGDPTKTPDALILHEKGRINEISVLDPTQVKSAIGNRGTFDPDDNNILRQPAYHGTPHKIARFSADKIGTGEGAQAYGHGLYFAENPEVARSYMHAGSTASRVQFRGEGVTNWALGHRAEAQAMSAATQRALGFVRDASSLAEALFNAKAWDDPDALGELQRMVDSGEVKESPPGHHYTVDIPDAIVDRMLDWDKPLSEQPVAVRAALKKLGIGPGKAPETMSDDELFGALSGYENTLAKGEATGQMLYKELASQIARPEKTALEAKRGAIIAKYNEHGNLIAARMFMNFDDRRAEHEISTKLAAMGNGDEKAASELLDSLGITGIRYLDRASRAHGEGTRNMVVFSDKHITITHEDGTPVTADERAQVLSQDNPLATRAALVGKDAPNQDRGQINMAMDVSSRPSVVSLFERADASTLQHELMHWWTEVYMHAAAQDGASDATKAIAQGLLGGAGVDTLDDWHGMSMDAKREGHETLARSWEAYLRDGRAPTHALQNVFSQFRSWLIRVYETVLQIGVAVSQDLRATFDAMIAFDDTRQTVHGHAQDTPQDHHEDEHADDDLAFGPCM